MTIKSQHQLGRTCYDRDCGWRSPPRCRFLIHGETPRSLWLGLVFPKPVGDNAIISRHFRNSSGWLRERAEWLRKRSRGGRRRQSQSTRSLIKGNNWCLFLPRYHSGVGLIRRTVTRSWMTLRGMVSSAQHGLCLYVNSGGKVKCVAVRDGCMCANNSVIIFKLSRMQRCSSEVRFQRPFLN